MDVVRVVSVRSLEVYSALVCHFDRIRRCRPRYSVRGVNYPILRLGNGFQDNYCIAQVLEAFVVCLALTITIPLVVRSFVRFRGMG